MLDLKTYQAIRGYITQYVSGDARIPTDGFVWGESKRLIDKMVSKPVYPFFWVRNIEWMASSNDGHSSIKFYWMLDIEIAGNATRGNIDDEENQTDISHAIMLDFFRFLLEEQRAQRIYFEFSRIPAHQGQVGEGENAWGWNFSVNIFMYPQNWCKADEDTRYDVSSWAPAFVDGEGRISITVDGTEYFYDWTAVEQQGHMLQGIVKQINQGSTDVTASTDEQYLYLASTTLNDSPIIILTPGEHTFTQLFQ